MNAPSNEDAEDEEQADEVLLDEDGETMEAEEAAGGSTQPTQAVVAAPAGSRARLRWPPITIVTISEGEDSEPKATYPFLRQGNYMDIMLVRQVMVDEPFAAPYGKIGQAWKACAEKLSMAQDPQGNLVFGVVGVNEKGLRKRFDELMAFVKKFEGSVPFQSGCDNEETTELMGALEDLYEIWTSAMSDMKTASSTNAAKKADNAAKAEALRNASLGMLTPGGRTLIQLSRRARNRRGGEEEDDIILEGSSGGSRKSSSISSKTRSNNNDNSPAGNGDQHSWWNLHNIGLSQEATHQYC